MITTHRTQGCTLPGSIPGVRPAPAALLAKYEAEMRRPLVPEDFSGITVYHDTAMTTIAVPWSKDRVNAMLGSDADVATMLATFRGWGARLQHLPALDTITATQVGVPLPYRQGFDTEWAHVIRR